MPPPYYSAESQRLWLEPLSIAHHLEDFHELWTDEEAVKWTIRVPKTTLAETAEWMPSLLPSEDMPDIDKWAILLRPLAGDELPAEDGDATSASPPRSERPKCIGIVGTNRWSDQGMETGYCINKAYWGKGYATESFRLFLDMYWGLAHRTYINSLVAKVYPDNAQSIKVLKKLNGREGEILKGIELRGGGGEKGDLYCWYFDRPGRDEVGEKTLHGGE